MLDIAAFCLVVTAVLAYLNHRFVGLPTAIGVMVTAPASSLAIVALSKLGITSLPLSPRTWNWSLPASHCSTTESASLSSLLLGMLASGATPTLAHAGELLLHEGGGGILYGLLGYPTGNARI